MENKQEITVQGKHLPHKAISETFVPKLLDAINANDVKSLVVLSSKVTIADSITAPTIKAWQKKLTADELADILSFLILRSASFFNLGNNMSSDQALETSYLLIERYPYETIEDFVLMFNRAKVGKYGELYNRLDGQLIFTWMGKYLEEKSSYRENEHQRIKSNNANLSIVQIPEDQKLIGDKLPLIGRSVTEALKEAINFKEFEANEKEFRNYKIAYLKQKSTNPENSELKVS